MVSIPSNSPVHGQFLINIIYGSGRYLPSQFLPLSKNYISSNQDSNEFPKQANQDGARIGSKPYVSVLLEQGNPNLGLDESARVRQAATCGIRGGNPTQFSTRRDVQRSANRVRSILRGHQIDAVLGPYRGAALDLVLEVSL